MEMTQIVSDLMCSCFFFLIFCSIECDYEEWRKKETRDKQKIFFHVVTGGLHDALQDDHDLKLLASEGALRQLEEGAPAGDLVADGERGHQEELVRPRAEAHVQLTLVKGQEFPLRGLPWLRTRESDGWSSVPKTLQIHNFTITMS